MATPKSRPLELTYPLRTVSRLTGLSPEVIRAWERRYGVVDPVRTAGGTRRYSAAELERLRLVKAAVDAGHRIGQVAKLGTDELVQRAAPDAPPPASRMEPILDALDALDAAEAQRLLALQLSALGPVRFAGDVAAPLAREIGVRWADQEIGIPVEHLATGVLRSMLGSALQPTSISLLGPRIVFATPSGERHELGVLMAALTALGSGGNPLYLGADVPVEDLVDAAERSGAAALALGIVSLPAAETRRTIAELRDRVPDSVEIWLGGAGVADVDLPDGVEYLASLEHFAQRVALRVASAPQRSAQ